MPEAANELTFTEISENFRHSKRSLSATESTSAKHTYLQVRLGGGFRGPGPRAYVGLDKAASLKPLFFGVASCESCVDRPDDPAGSVGQNPGCAAGRSAVALSIRLPARAPSRRGPYVTGLKRGRQNRFEFRHAAHDARLGGHQFVAQFPEDRPLEPAFLTVCQAGIR